MKLSQEKNEILDKLNFISIDKISKKTVPDSPGIYFFRLKDNSQFNTFENDKNDRISYIGKHESSLRERLFENHLNIYNNFSTFRRSVGSILKQNLSLSAYPRISKKTGKINSYSIFSFAKLKKIKEDKGVFIYDFDNFDDEIKLNEWIIYNFQFSFLKVNDMLIEDDLKKNEHEMRHMFKPALNCNHDDDYNEFRDRIKRLRKICANECRLNFKEN